MRVDRPLNFFFFSHLHRKTKSLISVLSKCFSYCLMVWSWLQIKSRLLFTQFSFSNTKDSQRSRVREGQSLFISANSTSSKTFSSQRTTVQCMYLPVCYTVSVFEVFLVCIFLHSDGIRANFRIQSKCPKMWTMKTPTMDIFHTVLTFD